MKKLFTLITMLFSVGVLSQEPIYLECRDSQDPDFVEVFTLFPDKDEVILETPADIIEKRITWSPTTVTIVRSSTISLNPLYTWRINRETLEYTYFSHVVNKPGEGTCEIVDTSGNQI